MARAERLLELPAERAIGVAGYAAGLTDFEAVGPDRTGRPRHRAVARSSAAGMADLSAPGQSAMSSQGAQASQGASRMASDSGGGSHSWGEPIRPTGAGSATGPATGSFHDEVLRTTADLDAMLALAGVTGAAVPGAAAQAARDERVEVPDTAEGAELPSAAEAAAAAAAAQRKAAAAVEDRSLPLLDPAARAAEKALPGMEDTSIIARRLVD
jgi:hypothetical protein